MNKSRIRSAFSLLELLIVVVVLALLTAMVLFRWSGIHRKAVMESAIDRLENVDQHLRQFARSRGRGCRLLFDRQQARFRKIYNDDDGPAWESLGQGLKLDKIQCGDEAARSREVEIPFNRSGVSPTYGVKLTGPGGRTALLVFAGVSGQMTILDSERAWHEALELTTGL